MRALKRLAVLKRRFDLRARWMAYWKHSPLARHFGLYRRAATLATLSWLLWL